MSADVAMTKKGFGEMAITATVAGPIFNVMFGGFLANISYLIDSGKEVEFTAYDEDGSISNLAVLPIVIICTQLVVLVILLINALINKF
jgi:Ca2+/Na+ antiporter